MSVAIKGGSSSIAGWLQAWRELPDNPLAAYYAQALRRSRKPSGVVLGYLPLLLGAALLAYLAWDLQRKLSWGMQISTADAILTLMPPVALCCLLYSPMLMGHVLVDALIVCGSLFSLSKTNRPELDELIYASRLSDHDIVLGLLRVFLPRLYIAAALGCAGIALLYLTGALFVHSMGVVVLYEASDLRGFLVFLPIVLIFAAPACIAQLLWLVALSGSVSRNFGGIAGRFQTLFQLAWIPASMFIINGYFFIFTENRITKYVDAPDVLLSALLMALLFFLLSALQLALAGRSAALRSLLSFGGPLLLPALCLILLRPGSILLSLIFPQGVAHSYPWLMMLGWSCGALMPVNPAAIPGVGWFSELLGTGPRSVPAMSTAEGWLMMLLLLALQLALVWLYSRYALAAVKRNRRAQ